MLNSPPCQFLDWDSEFFGFRIARVAGDQLSVASWKRVQDWCASESIRCLYLLASAADTETSLVAQYNGFQVVDVRVTLERDASPEGPVEGIRPARESDIPEIVDIAQNVHTDSRFYADPGFPNDLCSRLYGIWIEKSCSGRAKSVLVAERDGKPAGYISCDWSGETGQIGLLGVAPWAQGRGAGKALVNGATRTFRNAGMSRITVVTQARNLAAQRLYQRCGFVTSSMELWHHRWF